MFKMKKLFGAVVFALAVSLTAPAALPISNVVVAEAATVKLSQKKLELKVGKKAKLKIKGTKKKITWSTSNKKIATVSKTGVVKGIKPGKATIKATVNKKKYSCVVTVKDANPLIADAPFEAKAATFGKLKSVMPADWTTNVLLEQGNNSMMLLYPSSADMNQGTSNVTVVVQDSGKEKPDYEAVKEYFDDMISQDLIIAQLAQQGIEATLSDYKVSDYETNSGTAYRIDYTADVGEGTINQTIYYLYLENYLLQLSTTDVKDDVTPDVSTVAEYMLNCFEIAE